MVVGLDFALEGDFIRGPRPETAVFEAGEWGTTVTVPTVDDEQIEPPGSVALRLMSRGTGVISTSDRVKADVYDNDMPISIADAEGGEGDGVITFTVSLQGPAQGTTTVDVVTVDGKATSHGVVTATDFGKDFEAKNGTLTFLPGATSSTFT